MLFHWRLERHQNVRRGRELGFSIDELGGLLRLVDGHAYTWGEVHALTIQHLADIHQKIKDLRRLERVMSDIAARCTGDQVPDCPIIDALFEMQPVAGRSAPLKPTSDASSRQ
ncbi:DNA-binding transcriptional MerR regulator [Bradyrhizobium sp. i1.8.4]|uniref:MerR family DNA-binding protein n=1 Tax=unclassified Bradyrhizobium TaxID=2631580 RepID=UPI003D24A8B8